MHEAKQPTIFLVHGECDKSSTLGPLRDLLAEHGYPIVAAPSIPCSCRGSWPPVPPRVKEEDVIRQELQRLIVDEKQEVIVVGHRCGGFVAAESVRECEKTDDGDKGSMTNVLPTCDSSGGEKTAQ